MDAAAGTENSERRKVECLVSRARNAMKDIGNCGQGRVDDAVIALAWSLYKPENARMLAEMAVADTGMGDADSKYVKNTRKTFGTLRDLLRAKTVGLIGEDKDKGLAYFGKPVGVVGAVCPSTNPAATPVNKAMMAVKGGNAIIVAPSPAGHPEDLVQILPAPVNKGLTQELVAQADLAVVTGSQDNVRRAMRSGTVAIGVGAGNVPAIIDECADLEDAAQKIARSKTFDNATSCSSENAVVVLDSVYERAVEALEGAGGWLCDAAERESVEKNLWVDGKLNRRAIARDMRTLAGLFGLRTGAEKRKFLMVEEDGVGGKGSFADEKLSLVLALYRAGDFDDAKRIVRRILNVAGRGHSVGIHTRSAARAREVAAETEVVRVLVNQAHTFGNGGGFDNSLPFTLSMGGGTWAGNTIDDNLNYRCFINVTRLVTTIPEDKPSEEDLFGAYWNRFGK